MMIEISNGELLDKISILKIKSHNISDKDKLKNILNELDYLTQISKDLFLDNEIVILFNKLIDVNNKLWKIEDDIRNKESLKEFDEEFVFYARNVYITNDLRSKIKKEINEKTKSKFIEEKSYEKY